MKKLRILCAVVAAAAMAVSLALPVAAGWHHDGHHWQYQNQQSGECLKNCWQKVDGCWYRFDENGNMQTGWICDNNCWYYCDQSGAMKTGWFYDGKQWYYCNQSGAMQTGWIRDGGCWYYCDQSGAMKSGWVKDGDCWYYCSGSGVMQTGWLTVNGVRYFCNASGVMQTGIVQIDGVNYQFDENGGLVASNVSGYADAAYTSSGASAQMVDPVKDGTTVTVTIPEGKNASQIGAILQANGVCRQEDFLKALNQYQTTSATFDEMKGNSNLFLWYEGCLYPDTYEFYRYDNPENIIRKLLINFDNKISDDLKAQMEEKGLSLLETMTLASMIQKEAAKPEDMAKVSAVFWNRREAKGTYPKLQSNPTSDYADWIEANKAYGNSAVSASSYDTYQTNGLPAGPICNPGMDAILAALNPDENCNAYYFCTDKNGTFYFAETYAEHLQNVEKTKSN